MDARKAVYLRARARILIKVVDWLLVPERERERERERESNKNIGMAKCFGHFLLSLNKVYMSLSVLHNCYSLFLCGCLG